MPAAQLPQPYWQKRGCEHSHPSRVAYKKEKQILRNFSPFTKAEGRKLRHYVACVKTRKKMLGLKRHVNKLKDWRSSYPIKFGIRFYQFSYAVRAHLSSIASCESGGSPTAIGGGGLYRGKYQFAVGTWASVGGYGDPAAAAELEQDYRAAILLTQSGAGHWPVCAYQ